MSISHCPLTAAHSLLYLLDKTHSCWDFDQSKESNVDEHDCHARGVRYTKCLKPNPSSANKWNISGLGSIYSYPLERCIRLPKNRHSHGPYVYIYYLMEMFNDQLSVRIHNSEKMYGLKLWLCLWFPIVLKEKDSQQGNASEDGIYAWMYKETGFHGWPTSSEFSWHFNIKV